MKRRFPPRLIAPLIAVGIAGAAAIVGGACLPTSSSPPTVQTGNYILTTPGIGALPGFITDSAGRTLRVIADTLTFNVSDQTYEERGTAAITPAGGTEQPPAPFAVSRQRYIMSADATLVLPVTFFGRMIKVDILSPTTVALQNLDHRGWQYVYR
jgi:hypothetical protein